ncbi:DNA replication and repair protein RecF [Georgenia satyanarayanai]|uniref:DNA replication and repair protein RecF n=1 Tax=Georgenia satyanarayanai TaxID=860221 RepID=A0A2Y9C7G3_9MICO|nr:DNA replication/repair protein RecF [Georgenia satyanarayanai]PYF97753.1 DNA replication and repair protein RecF [Georgenia satyanarayanai]SSA45493.1 DNA replication and repair protein RecF [Georgenia satyanarayanai]
MYVSNLSLHDFRSYAELVLALDPGVTAFVGHNGQGKTNIVEAVAYLGTFSSHRVASDAALVRHGTGGAVVRAKAVREGRETLVELEIVAGKANRARLNRAPVSRTRDVLGIVRSVVFAPEDLELVKGDPQVRRRFLDDLLVLLAPRLAGVRSEYDKILRQRGALLKTAGAARRRGASPDLSTLDVWDRHLAAAGAEVVAARIDLLGRLRPRVAQAYEQVSAGQGEARLGYRSALLGLDGEGEATPEEEHALTDVGPLEERLVEAMARVRSKEIDRGVSLIGPHRDDLVLTLGGLPAKGYASHGESWSYALALRLASFEVLSDDDDGGPVLILDDVFAELDVRRRERLATMVGGAEQVLITAAVAEDVPESLRGARFTVANGEVARE